MPRTGYKSNDNLGIELDRWQAFAPGNVVAGTVTRAAPLASQQAILTLRLFGRAKAKIAVKQQHGSSYYRNRFNFFDDCNTTWTLFDGALDVVAGGPQAWHFAAQLPTAASASALSETRKPDTSLLPLDPQTVSQELLPDAFYYKGSNVWSSTTLLGYVEYYLEATLSTAKGKSWTATVPLWVSSPEYTSLSKEDGFALCSSAEQIALSPTLFVPKAEQATLIRRKSMFGSKIKDVGFNVTTGCPSRLQLGCRIPFFVSVTASNEDADTISKYPHLKFRVEEFSMTIKSTTTVVCPATFSPKRVSKTEKYNIDCSKLLQNRAEPILLSPGAYSKSLNLGDLLGLELQADGVLIAGEKHGKPFKPPLAADFTTYCLSHTSQLSWELRLSAFGLNKTKKVYGEIPIRVLRTNQEQVTKAMEELSDNQRKEMFMAAGEFGLEALGLATDIASAFLA